MKRHFLFILGAMLISTASFAQNSKNCTSKTIKIDDDGKNPVVKITTVENGKKNKQVLKGEAARKYIEEQNGTESSSSYSTTKSSNAYVIDLTGLENLEDDLERLEEQIERQVEAATAELDSDEFKVMMSSVEESLKDAFGTFSYQYTTDNENSHTYVITNQRGDEDIEVIVEIDTDSDNDDEGTSNRSIDIEDMPGSGDEPELKLKKLSTKARSNSVRVAYENESGNQVEITLRNEEGKTMHKTIMVGEGSQTIEIDLSDVPVGDYTLEFEQDDKRTTKKLEVR